MSLFTQLLEVSKTNAGRPDAMLLNELWLSIEDWNHDNGMKLDPEQETKNFLKLKAKLARGLDKICPSCGAKHAGAFKECRDCRNIDDNADPFYTDIIERGISR
jgi:hypothetical protein